ncbi:MAG TPA: EF-hand domain-containing protein [Rhizobiaceae bacterium]|nr:EF-hand domain-containing protein [Rhizobiaceae bacterium]
MAATAPSPAKAQTRDPSQLLARADLNGDGQITRQEFVSARAQTFTRLDRNGDGFLSTADAPRRFIGRQKAEGRIRDLMQTLDTNRDGWVSREEFVNGPVRLFAVADSDGNDVIDRSELAAFRANAAKRRQR